MKLEAGDLVLVPFPFTDLSARKTRPALVLSSGAYNERSADVIVAGVTSNLALAANSVLIDARDMEDGELRATSRVKVDKVVTLQQRLVRRRVGRLGHEAFYRVLREFLSLFPRMG